MKWKRQKRKRRPQISQRRQGHSMRILIGPLLLLTGCAIADRSDKFGADLEIGVGGILGYIADVHLKASVGFSKTCKENADENSDHVDDPVGLRGFL
jgi:hypothetical protein